MVLPLKRVFANVTPVGKGRQWGNVQPNPMSGPAVPQLSSGVPVTDVNNVRSLPVFCAPGVPEQSADSVLPW